jgi:malonyl-CoA decarboxylase
MRVVRGLLRLRIVITGGSSSVVPVNSTASRRRYRIDGSDASISSPADAGSAVNDALAECHHLLSERGEAQGNRLAAGILARYASFDEAARAAFFDSLADRFSVDPSGLRRAAECYIHDACDENLHMLLRAGEVPRRELFLRLNGAIGGAAWLVHMREQLQKDQRWPAVENDLTRVLRVLFNLAVLDFQQIGLETPCSLLERLIAAEAVHPINDWSEMGRRLEADRRCYAFFHPAWPQEPLIFTEVALTRGIPSMVQPILDPDAAVVDPRTCDTAIFYSISNCQPGLRGFSFGNALLGRAIERLRLEMPWLRRFATISPIPGFRSWLSKSAGLLNASTPIRAWLSKQSHSSNDATPGELQGELLALCAHYLLVVKQGSEPADAVARFHLGNGARLYRLNGSSDLSRTGIGRAFGLTVNYVYDPNQLERNAEAYRRSHEFRASSAIVRRAQLAARLISDRSLVA